VKKHTKIFMEHHGFTIADFIPCAMCGKRAVDLHHIDCRGMGGSKGKDNPENLMAMCRECHIRYGDKKQYMDELKQRNETYYSNKTTKR
jgi:5-methylcytosine-specific restriction endonuclease McrA